MRNLLLLSGLVAFANGIALGQERPSPPTPSAPDRPFIQPIASPNDPVPTTLPDVLLPALTDSFRVWAEVDYLMWFIKPVCLKPATLTTGSPTDPSPGALGQPNTKVVMGDHKFEFGPLSGFRPTFGVWLDSEKTFGLEANGFLMQQGFAKLVFDSTKGAPATYIPFQNPQNVQQALPFSTPRLINGSAMAVGNSWLWGTELDAVAGFTTTRGALTFRSDMLFGARYLDLRDKVNLSNTQSLVANPSTFAFGAADFTTHNQFYGGEIGMRFGVDWGRWSVNYQTKLALGETHQVSEVTGSALLGGQGSSPLLMPGPVLALASNSIRQSADRITLVPEAALKLRYRCSNWMSINLGYSCLYWNKVLCPGDQMDNHLNVTQLPGRGPQSGPPAPAPLFVHTDFFAQGYNVGVEFCY